MSAWQRFWCRMTFRHRGHVGWVEGPYWMCDNCGAVIR